MRAKRALAWVLLMPTVALAQPESGELAGGLARILERMESPVWGEREDATSALIASESIVMREIDAALASGDLSPEQRARLTFAAVQRYRREPLAGLGVQFGNGGPGAVQIAAVVPGFPASDILRAGDVLLAVGDDLGGGLIGGQDDLRAEILSRRPGDVMPVLIRRGLRTLELGLPLGEYANLQDAAMLDDQTVRRAMELRRARMNRDTAGPDAVIGSGLDMRSWIAGAFPEGTWEGLIGGGERRDPGIVPGGPSSELWSRNRQMQLRGFWSGVEEALGEGAEYARGSISRAMSAGVLLRGVFLEHESSLIDQIEEGEALGEDTSGLRVSLDRLRAQLAELDARLTETARRLDDSQRVGE